MRKKKNLFIFILLAFIVVYDGFFFRYFTRPSTQKSLDGYPKYTVTRHGIPGDPINIIFIANQSVIQHDFLKAGWKIPDPITKQTSVRIGLDSILGKPYPNAPLSNLYLYGRKQDMAFELPGKTVRTRDHIRLWNSGDTYLGQQIWVASATRDAGIEISHTNDVPTHHIAPNIDEERDFVKVELQPYMRSEILIPYAKPVKNAENGGGDYYYTDGKIAILSSSITINHSDFHISS
jgi:hypothetical protein